MERSRRIRSAVILEAALLFLMGVILWENGKLPQKSAMETTADGYIKWVDFNVSYEALSRAYEYDISSYGEKQHLDWIDLLAYVGAKNGGDFVKQIAYPVIHKFFCLGGQCHPAVALLGSAKLLFKDSLFFVQRFQFSNDILCRSRIGAAGERVYQIPDGVGRLFQIRAHFAGINVRDIFFKFNAVRRQLDLF